MGCSTRASIKKADRLAFLRTLCAVDEGAAVIHVGSHEPEPEAAPLSAVTAAAAACVAAVLDDPRHRLTALGGRVGLPRSLGSDFGGFVTRFLVGFQGIASRTIPTPGLGANGAYVAVTRDGATLLVSDFTANGGVHAFSVHTGAFLRVIDELQDTRRMFYRYLCQIWVASDGFVFIAETGDIGINFVRVLTPQLTFHGDVGEHMLDDMLNDPCGVCVNDDVIAVTDDDNIAVLDRRTGTRIRRIGSYGCEDGELLNPLGMCFWPGPSYIAVADRDNGRVSIFGVDGEFVRHVGVGKLRGPTAVACFMTNELVVADETADRVVLFNQRGEVVWMSEKTGYNVTGVAAHGGSIYAQTASGVCIVFT